MSLLFYLRTKSVISCINITFVYYGILNIQYIPENDSPVNINTVIMFYDRLVQQEDRNTQISNIRRFAEMHFDIKVVMKPMLTKITQL